MRHVVLLLLTYCVAIHKAENPMVQGLWQQVFLQYDGWLTARQDTVEYPVWPTPAG
jgi:hypothetical protein